MKSILILAGVLLTTVLLSLATVFYFRFETKENEPEGSRKLAFSGGKNVAGQTDQINETKENELNGSWKLVSAGGKNVEGHSQIKFISENSFIWTRFNNDGEMYLGAGGKLSFEENTFTETVVMATASIKSIIGQRFIYEYELRNNKLYMKGKIGNSNMEEVWEKIE